MIKLIKNNLKINIIRELLIISIGVFILLAIPVRAQYESDIPIKMTPEIPGAYERTTLKIESYLIDTETTKISWSQDGKLKLSGIGEESFSFTTGEVGSKTTIKTVVATSGGSISKTTIIQPAEIDLLWQATDSYVPPFYKGKALPSSEAKIKVVAIPNVKVNNRGLGVNDFVFNWKKNYNIMPGSSGFGKDSFNLTSNILNDAEKITLKIASLDGKYGAQNNISIKTTDPKIVFYENNPIRGINYDNALNNGFSMTSEETTIVAEPYFFSPSDIYLRDYKYQWLINNQTIEIPSPQNILIVRRGEGGGGVTTISLSMENMMKLFQSAKASMSINL